MALTTNRICGEMVGEAYSDEFGEWYENGCRRYGKVSKVKLDFGIRAQRTGRLQTETVDTEWFGDFSSGRTRVKWAVQCLEALQFNEDEGEVELIRVIESRSKRELFSIRMVTMTGQLEGVSDLNWKDVRDPNGHYEVVWFFEEEEERASIEVPDATDETSFWISGDSRRAFVANLLRRGLEFNHLGLHKVVCESVTMAKPIFEVLLDATVVGDAA